MPHYGELPKIVHPKVAASITANTHPPSLGKSLCLPEDCDVIAFNLANAGTAPIPHGACLQKNSVGFRPVCADGLGKQTKGKSSASLGSFRHDKAAICADIGLVFSIKSNRAVAIYASARAGERYPFKPVALLPVKTATVPRQEASIRRFAETQNYFAGKTLSRPIALKPLSIESENAAFRPRPQEACPILQEDFHGQVSQTIFCSVITETVFLSG